MHPKLLQGSGDFAFQTGSWRVRHCRLRRRLASETNWDEFDGSCRAFEVMGGAGNIDDHFLDDPAGAWRAATFRKFDPGAGLWSIWWFDSRFAELGPPVHGRFERGIGTFFGDDILDGRPIRVRFIWSEIDAGHARWEQAFSPDGGESWECNWIMAFERVDGDLPAIAG